MATKTTTTATKKPQAINYDGMAFTTANGKTWRVKPIENGDLEITLVSDGIVAIKPVMSNRVVISQANYDG